MSGQLEYLATEFDLYEPPPCPRCGNPQTIRWVEVTRRGDPEPLYRPGMHYCETPGCHRPESERVPA